MDNKNEFQELLEKLLKEQEAKLTKQFEKEKQALIAQHAQREQEWSSLFDAQTQTVATVVADHIGKEVVSSYTAKFGADSEATQHAKEIPYQEHAQVAAQFLKADGQVMTADEFAAKHTSTWDEFNAMGGLTTSTPTQELDPFLEPAGPVAAPTLDQDTKDVMAAIDYQVQNYSFEDNFPVEPAPTAFSKARAQGVIGAMRSTYSTETPTPTPTEPRKAPTAANAEVPAAAEPATSMTKQDTEQSSSITAEMLAATQEASTFMADANFILRNQGFGTITEYRTMSPNDKSLSYEAMMEETGKEKFNVSGNSRELVNYFDKVRNFGFAGKTAQEHRAKAIEKNDVQEWLNSFQPARQAMNEAHESEKKLMPFNATDKEVEQMNLKHKFEKSFFDYHEKKEISKAPQYFKNEFLDSVPNLGYVTKQDEKELHNLFKDYSAHRQGKTWKHVYASNDQDPSSPQRMSRDAIVAAMQRNQEIRNAIKTDSSIKIIKSPKTRQIEKKIKAMRTM